MDRRVRDVLVVGAGVGGLCAAIRLARAGLDVEILEKNRAPGGRCGRIERDGHRFDTGPTLFVLPELYRAEFDALGIRMEEAFDLRRIDPTYRLAFDDGALLDLTGDAAALRSQLERLSSGSHAGVAAYLAEGERHYENAVEGFVRRDFRTVRDLVGRGGLRALAAMHLHARHWTRAARWLRSDRLRAAFTFQDLYMGMSPMEAPATFSLLPYSELRHGVWFPMGGMYRVTEVLVAAAREAGVRIRVRAPVSGLEVGVDRVSAVRMEDGRSVRARVVLANADLPYVEERLLPDGLGRRWGGGRRFSSSCVSFLWAVDRPLEELRPHTLFLTDDFERGLRAINAGEALPGSPCFYVHAPTRIDPDMAPPGAETLVVIVPVANLGTAGDADWGSVRARARRHVLDGLARIGAPCVERHLKFEIAFQPSSWRRRYNLTYGAAHGLAHRLGQLGPFRPRNRHAWLENLYYAGASTHPGSGVPTAMVSGRLAAERILEEHGRAIAPRGPGSARRPRPARL